MSCLFQLKKMYAPILWRRTRIHQLNDAAKIAQLGFIEALLYENRTHEKKKVWNMIVTSHRSRFFSEIVIEKALLGCY